MASAFDAPRVHIKIMRIQFSAGGIVLKKVHSPSGGLQVFILVSQHSQHHGWVFPKGIIGDHDKNESKEETAVREVKEETGILGKIIKPLTPIEYWFVLDKEKIKKTVYYFIMEYISGDTKNHDFEMENVEWLKANEVEKRLTYPSDKKVWQQAKKLII